MSRGKVAFRTRLAIFLRDDFCCLFCGGTFDTRDLTLDHLHPKADGGTHRIRNLATACGPCNHEKNDTSWVDWDCSVVEEVARRRQRNFSHCQRFVSCLVTLYGKVATHDKLTALSVQIRKSARSTF